jgi:transcriptional regulator with XRE-family HTH domain
MLATSIKDSRIVSMQDNRIPLLAELDFSKYRYLFTQRAIAEYFGVTKQTISKYLTHLGEEYIEAPHVYSDYYGKQRMRKLRYYDISSLQRLTLFISNDRSKRVEEFIGGFEPKILNNLRRIDKRFALPDYYVN